MCQDKKQGTDPPDQAEKLQQSEANQTGHINVLHRRLSVREQMEHRKKDSIKQLSQLQKITDWLDSDPGFTKKLEQYMEMLERSYN